MKEVFHVPHASQEYSLFIQKKLCFPFIHFSTLCNIAAMCFLLQILIVLNSLTDKLL